MLIILFKKQLIDLNLNLNYKKNLNIIYLY
jgi:hypothetical protein